MQKNHGRIHTFFAHMVCHIAPKRVIFRLHANLIYDYLKKFTKKIFLGKFGNRIFSPQNNTSFVKSICAKECFFPSFVEDLEFFYYYEQDCQHHIEIKTLAQFFSISISIFLKWMHIYIHNVYVFYEHIFESNSVGVKLYYVLNVIHYKCK